MGTQGGINATHLLLLRENSRPAWMLMPGNLYDSEPPVLGKPKVWVPTASHPVEDALLMFAILGAKDRSVKAVFDEFEKSRTRNRLDLDDLFGKGVPKEVYAACQRHLSDWHVIVSVGSYSLAKRDLSVLKNIGNWTSQFEKQGASKAISDLQLVRDRSAFAIQWLRSVHL